MWIIWTAIATCSIATGLLGVWFGYRLGRWVEWRFWTRDF